jgi:hypothetical protein
MLVHLLLHWFGANSEQGAQAPLKQKDPEPQALPHPPQLAGSDWKFTHWFPHLLGDSAAHEVQPISG